MPIYFDLTTKSKEIMKKIRAAIVGYGNIGKYALEALQESDDFEIAGIVRRKGAEDKPAELADYDVVKSIKELKDVDVAILATPTRSVEKYAKEILALGINTVDSVHTLLHPVFQMAVRDEIIRSNPSDRVMADLKKKLGRHIGVRRALTIEQQRAFLDFIKDDDYARWRNLFVVMFGTGMRVGELIGLRWEDIDLDEESIEVNHNVTYYPRVEGSHKCEFDVSLPKTPAGIRTIPMLPQVREAFIREKEQQELLGISCESEVKGMKGFIFCNRFGKLHNPATINREIKRLVTNHNAMEEVKAAREHREPIMIPAFSNHIARHTFCARLCEQDVNVKVIQSVMGHKDIQTTLDIYAEVTNGKKQKVFRQLANDLVIF